MTLQEQIDELLKVIEDNRKLMGIPKILIPANSKNIIQETIVIPADATEFEKTIMETIDMVRKLQNCPKCNPDKGGMQVLDWETGKWNCVIHKD